ncbi:MAG: DUF721 domain-containing protein [Chitinophagaceae bacterium]
MAEYSIKDAIKKMIQESHWKPSYMATKLLNDWESIVGKAVAKHTKDLVISDRKLIIYTDIAPLKQELSYNKHLLIEKINTYLEEEFIKDILIK